MTTSQLEELFLKETGLVAPPENVAHRRSAAANALRRRRASVAEKIYSGGDCCY